MPPPPPLALAPLCRNYLRLQPWPQPSSATPDGSNCRMYSQHASSMHPTGKLSCSCMRTIPHGHQQINEKIHTGSSFHMRIMSNLKPLQLYFYWPIFCFNLLSPKTKLYTAYNLTSILLSPSLLCTIMTLQDFL